MRWDIRARVDTVTPEMIEALARAGCSRVHYGVETGSPRIQKRLRKNLDLARVREVFGITRRAGMEVLGYFMVGNPDETIEDVRMTFELIRSLPMDYAHIGVFTPYPGTEIYRLALEQGVYERDYWRSSRGPAPGFHAALLEPALHRRAAAGADEGGVPPLLRPAGLPARPGAQGALRRGTVDKGGSGSGSSAR